MACEFPVAVTAKLMLTAMHCLLFFYNTAQNSSNYFPS